MSGKKHCKGVDVVCPFWRCETPLTITCEGWMAGCDVQLRFSGQGEKLAYMRRRCKRMDGWGKCLVAVGAGRKYEKKQKNFRKTCENVLTIDNIYSTI